MFFEAARASVFWDVPVFFMITGALLLNPEKKLSIKHILLYIRRVLLVIFIFGVPCAILMTMMELNVKVINWEVIQISFVSVIENTALGHFWYLYVLTGIYLILPLLKIFVKNANNVEIIFLMVSLLIFDFVFPLISKIGGIDIAFNIPLTYPCFYMLLGYLMSKSKNQLMRYRKTAAIVVFTLFAFSWILNYTTIVDATILFSYSSPIIVLYAAGLFMLFATGNWKTRDYIWNIDRLCFAVYIIHVLLIQFCYRVLKIQPIHCVLYPAQTFAFGVIFTVSSFLGAWALYKIKPLKKYVL